MEVYNGKALSGSPKFAAYELEDANVDELASFALTNAIFATLVEGHAAEIVSCFARLIQWGLLSDVASAHAEMPWKTLQRTPAN